MVACALRWGIRLHTDRARAAAEEANARRLATHHIDKAEQVTARSWQRLRQEIAAELVQAGDYPSVEVAVRDRGLA